MHLKKRKKIYCLSQSFLKSVAVVCRRSKFLMYKHVISLKLQWNSLNIYIKKVIRTKEKMWDSNDLFFLFRWQGKGKCLMKIQPQQENHQKIKRNQRKHIKSCVSIRVLIKGSVGAGLKFGQDILKFDNGWLCHLTED